MKMNNILALILISILIGCKTDETIIQEVVTEPENYYPPAMGSNWESTSFESLNWNASAAANLYNFLSDNGTRAFIVLKDGKIVIERYWGNDILNSAAFGAETNWYWASAGKTLTAFLVGMAQDEGLLNIHDKTSIHLGENWSNLSLEKENLILLKNQLTMTTGLDYNVPNPDCTSTNCLQYKADAGNQWYYHNAPYTLLEQVVSNASNMNYNDFTASRIGSKIGMGGTWIQLGDNNVYWSTARDAARFGLLLLNKGAWDNNEILLTSGYYNAMVNSSQNLNPSYGYLTWLNGKSSIVLPGLPISFNLPLSENAPSDLFAALGKNGQFIDIVPSENLVVIRMGEAPDNGLVPTIFHDEMWEFINLVKN